METETAPVDTPVIDTTALDRDSIETQSTPDEYGTASIPIARTGPEDDEDGAAKERD